MRRSQQSLLHHRLVIACASVNILVSPLAVFAQEGPSEAPSTSLSRQISDSTFTQPLLFAPEDNGFELGKPQLKWLMGKGDAININGLIVRSSTIALIADQTPRESTPSRFRNSEHTDPMVTRLSFKWPTSLTQFGHFSIEDESGNVMWSAPISEQTLGEWSSRLPGKGSRNAPRFTDHLSAIWGVYDLPEAATKAVFSGSPIRGCLLQKESESASLKICTSPHKSEKGQDGAFRLQPIVQEVDGTVFIGNTDIGPRGIVNFNIGQAFKLKTLFKNQSYIELSSQPVDLKLIDVVENTNGTRVILTGEGTQPVGKATVIRHPESHFWAATGVKKEIVWQLTIPRSTPVLRILGSFNIPFSMVFKFDHLPSERDRVFLRKSLSNGTYSARPILLGHSPNPVRVRSTEFEAKNIDDTHFKWTFAAPIKDTENRARLIVSSNIGKSGTSGNSGTSGESRKWVAHHRLYRGYPIETSGRLTGVTASNAQMAILGEVAGSMWFENLFSSSNYYLSQQRWGILARYFKTMTSLQNEPGLNLNNFTAYNIDLKYNLIPGIWNRDELFGIIMSFQNVNVSGYPVNLGGTGLFWARTMPKVFDDFFNIVPFMRYSKYVDMDLIYYPLALTSTAKANPSYSLNFHGKVFWSRRVFGEAGFGLKQYKYVDNSSNVQIEFATAYGTMGLGMLF